MNKFFILFLLASCTASAATKSAKVFKADTDAVPTLTEDEYQKIIADGKKFEASRKVANVDRIDYATAVADDFKNLTSDFVGGSKWKDQKEVPNSKESGMHTNADLAKEIDILEAKYPILSPAAQIVTAQLIALKPFRGMVYRLRPLVEAQHTPFIHGMIIAFIRSVNAGVNNLFPSDQWKVGFDYLTQPYPNMGAQITTEQELNAYLGTHVIHEFVTLFNRVKGINLDTPVYMDNRLLWGTAHFVADQDQFVLFGNSEKLSYLSNVSFAISGLGASLAYNWLGMFETTQKFWMVYGFNTALSNPDNMTAEQRVSVIRKNSDLFTLLPGGEKITKAAKKWYKIGLSYGKQSWGKVQDAQKDSAQPTVMDARGFLPFVRIINTSFTNVDEIVSGKGVSSSLVNGEVVAVNFDLFFDQPPKDFKDFLPTKFDQGAYSVVEPVTGIKYRNYSRGNPTAWNYAAYQIYFPGVKDAHGVRNAARVMSQSWGSTLLGLPLSTMMF